MYDFEGANWIPFIEPRMASQGLPQPFYTPQRLGAKMPPDRLRSMEAQILGELVLQLKRGAREARPSDPHARDHGTRATMARARPWHARAATRARWSHRERA